MVNRLIARNIGSVHPFVFAFLICVKCGLCDRLNFNIFSAGGFWEGAAVQEGTSVFANGRIIILEVSHSRIAAGRGGAKAGGCTIGTIADTVGRTEITKGLVL